MAEPENPKTDTRPDMKIWGGVRGRKNLKKIGLRRCVGCAQVLPISDFTGTNAGKGRYRCRPCNSSHTRQMLVNRKDKAFQALGGWKCRCCGVAERDFLTIDHIHGGGNKFRQQKPGGDRIYNVVLSMRFPSLEFQVLCMNCNWAKGKHGQCPHTAARAA